MRLDPKQQDDLRDYDSPFSPLNLIGERARYLGEDELREAYDDALAAVLEGEVRLGAVDETVREHGLDLVDRITAELARHASIDVVAALAIGVTLDGFVEVQDQATGTLMMIVDPWCPSEAPGSNNTVWMSDEVTWTAQGIVAELPHTLAMAAVGRPLKDVISHPVTDRHALMVTGIGQTTSGDMMIHTDADMTAIGLDELVAMRQEDRP